ncbi:MAG: cytochrome c peroxidase, partial [Myxococcota bacterium]|nr:cytochrome c peroxidase [Myxococcota bacterium]
ASYSPLGDWIYVAMLGSETVDVLDAYSFESVGSYAGLGHGVDALWAAPSGDRLWVLASLSRELILVSLEGGEGELARLDLRPGGLEVLAPEVLLGKQVFHRAADPRMSLDGYLSCASCHLEGSEDGRVWDFTDRGEGLRNTLTLQGSAGTGFGPIHWSGNFDEVQDFENDIRTSFAGAGFLSETDWDVASEPLGEPKAGRSVELDALASYLGTLTAVPDSPYREADGSFSPEALAGEILFESPTLGCISCHPPPDYTDSQWLPDGSPLLHDVGTIGPGSGGRSGGKLAGLDTPSLRGLWATPPYLHDGSAATLGDVLTSANPEDLHGTTSQLSEAELARLIAFLMQLE